MANRWAIELIKQGQETVTERVRLLTGRDKRALAGHPWIYSNEIQMDETAKRMAPGTLVRVERGDGQAIGRAMFNPHALIAARLLTRDPDQAIDSDFLAGRLKRALALRERLYPGGAYRLIHAEADGLPGLIVDRYGDVLAVQINTAGMDRLTEPLVAALIRVLSPRAIVLRNDSPARTLEGLALETRIVHGALNGPVEFNENNLVFRADPRGGQKTGWFFDQRDNRALAARHAAGRAVLDLYCYGGGFALAAAAAGATSVLAVDSSAPALALAGEAAQRNGLGPLVTTRRAEVFSELVRLGQANERFGLVIADPPAFVKSKKDLAAGARAYRKLARLACGVTQEGGVLFIASCSHNIDVPLFAEQVRRGLTDAGRTGRILATVGAAADHPVHPHLPESAYLKGQILELD